MCLDKNFLTPCSPPTHLNFYNRAEILDIDILKHIPSIKEEELAALDAGDVAGAVADACATWEASE